MEQGIGNIVALRGDPPRGETQFEATAGGLSYANELVSLLRGEFSDFGVAVAGYPETHREAPSPEIDLENLRRKVDAGADIIITQLFYDNDDFWRFRDRCHQAGMRSSHRAGYLAGNQLGADSAHCLVVRRRLPAPFQAALEKSAHDASGQFDVGVEFATRQVQQLIDGGVPGIHFYVLNKSPATSAVLRTVALSRSSD